MSLKTLQELTQIVTKNKLRSIELVQSSNGDSKIAALYEWLLANRLATDEEAAQHFYQADKQHSGYQKLKNTLKNRLINSLFFIDVKHPAYNERKRAYYECYKDWAAAKILMSRNAKITGIELSFKILKQAKQYEFTELTLDIYRMLRLYYGSIEGDLKKFEHYNALFKHCEQVWQQENLAEELYTSLVANYVNARATKEIIYQQAKAYYTQLTPPLYKYDTYQLQLCGLLIHLLVYSSTNDYEGTVRVCKDGIDRFSAKAYDADVPLQACYHQLLVSYTQLRRYSAGRQAAEECLRRSLEGSFNWFKYQELYFLLGMHTREYQAVYDIAKTAMAHSSYKFLPPQMLETWQINQAYLYFLAAIQKIDILPTDPMAKTFKLSKFLNEIAIFSKDKQGMNIPIVIIQVLFMLLQKKYDLAIDRMEAIEKYCVRHLSDEDNIRSNYFIRMLLQIPAASFCRNQAIQRAQKYLEGLQQHPIDLANQAHEIEIIPYEDLWVFVLGTLPG